MDEFESLSHSKWECKYHIVFIPKFRRKVLYGELRRHLGEVFRKLAEQRESRVEEGHLMPDHVHMMLSIPPKYAVSQVVGYIKGKSAIHLAGCMASAAETSSGSTFGPEDFSFLRSGATRTPSAITSRTKRNRTSAWIN
jgi:putative transposase